MVSADCANSASRTSAITRQNGESQMTKMKTLHAVIILSAAIATPVFAQDHGRAHVQHFRGAYNQMIGPSYYVPSSRAERNLENFGFSGRDPSRVGGEDPYLHPG